MNIQAITAEYGRTVNEILKDEWNAPLSVSRGIY